MSHVVACGDGRIVTMAAELCLSLFELRLSVGTLEKAQHRGGGHRAERGSELPLAELSGDADTEIEQNCCDGCLSGVVGTSDCFAQSFERDRVFAAMDAK